MKTVIWIKPGAGGEESRGFANILFNMYKTWAKRHLIPTQCSSETGHEFTLIMNTDFPVLEQEHGIHRLCRISPYDSQGRRHTSFAAVEVSGITEVHNGPIRSYTLDPYKKAEDIRKNYTTENVDDVLAGLEELDKMIDAPKNKFAIGDTGAHIVNRTLTKEEADYALTLTPTIHSDK